MYKKNKTMLFGNYLLLIHNIDPIKDIYFNQITKKKKKSSIGNTLNHLPIKTIRDCDAILAIFYFHFTDGVFKDK